MKVFLFGFFLSAFSLAIESPPSLQGVILTGLTDRQPFTFNPGEVQSCRTVVTTPEGHVISECALKDTQALVTGDPATSLYLKFDKMTVLEKKTADGSPEVEYRYRGQWSSISLQVPLSSEIKLWLMTTDSKTTPIKGTLEMVDLGLKSTLVATPFTADAKK